MADLKKTRRPRRSPHELQAAAAHVIYELETMKFAAEHLEWGHASPAVPPYGKERDSLLESFLLHFRNLRAFLRPSLQGAPPKIDDIVGSDFFAEEQARDVISSNALGFRKTWLDRSVAHLSYSRLAYDRDGQKKWPVLDMCRTIEAPFVEFLASLPPERRAWFAPSENKASELVRPATGIKKAAKRPGKAAAVEFPAPPPTTIVTYGPLEDDDTGDNRVLEIYAEDGEE